MDKCCATCHHWQPDDRSRAYVADCAAGAIPRPEFWQACAEWRDPNAAADDQMTLQSQSRGAAVPYFGSYITGVKP